MPASEAVEIVGRRVRLIREQLNLSQGQLAGRVGLSQANLSRYESGELDMPLTRLVKLSEALNVKTSVLVRGLGGRAKTS